MATTNTNGARQLQVTNELQKQEIMKIGGIMFKDDRTAYSHVQQLDKNIATLNSLVQKKEWSEKDQDTFYKTISNTARLFDRIRDQTKSLGQQVPPELLSIARKATQPKPEPKQEIKAPQDPALSQTQAQLAQEQTKTSVLEEKVDKTNRALKDTNAKLKETTSELNTAKKGIKEQEQQFGDERKKTQQLGEQIEATQQKVKSLEETLSATQKEMEKAQSETKKAQQEANTANNPGEGVMPVNEESPPSSYNDLTSEASQIESSTEEDTAPADDVVGEEEPLNETTSPNNTMGTQEPAQTPKQEQEQELRSNTNNNSTTQSQSQRKSTPNPDKPADKKESAPSSSNPFQSLLELLKNLLAKLFGGGGKNQEGIEKRGTAAEKREENIEMADLGQPQEHASQIEKKPEVNRTEETTFNSSAQVEQESTRRPLTSPKDSSINDQSVINEQQRALDQYKTENKGMEQTEAPKTTSTSKEQLEGDHAFAMNLAREEMAELRSKDKPSQDNPQQLKSMEDTPNPSDESKENHHP